MTVPAGGVSPDAAPGPADAHHLHVFPSPMFNLIASSKTLLPMLSHSEVQRLKIQCMDGVGACKEHSSRCIYFKYICGLTGGINYGGAQSLPCPLKQKL